MGRMSYMKLTFALKDSLGNDAYVKIKGERVQPGSLKENLLDVSILELRKCVHS